jgi:hypothetical protein
MIDSLGTLIDEMAEAVEMLRTYYPEESETDLRQRAAALRAERYQSGRWPVPLIVRLSHDEISPAPMEAEPTERKPGRPKGSKNKPKRGRPKGSKNRPKAQLAALSCPNRPNDGG